jgi:hypothetical protein
MRGEKREKIRREGGEKRGGREERGERRWGR